MHMWGGEFSMLAVLKSQKSHWIFSENWFVCFEYVCMEEKCGNLSRTFINGLSSVLI